MYTFLPDLADLLEDNELGTVYDGSTGNIFLGELPKDATNGIYLIQASSPAPDAYIDTQYTNVDVWVRNASGNDAFRDAYNVLLAIHRKANFSMGNYYVYLATAISQPEDMDRDREGGKLVKITFNFIFRDINIIS